MSPPAAPAPPSMRAEARRPPPLAVCRPRQRGGARRPKRGAVASWLWCCARAPSWLGLRFDLHRQREGKHRTFADLRLDPEPAAVQLDDAPRDRKAKASAALLLGGGIVGLLEFLED